MKANVPEKVYIEPNLDSIWGMAERSCESEVEYTRTDAFIEKAVSYLEGTLFNKVCYGEIRPDIVQAYINDFKKAMRV